MMLLPRGAFAFVLICSSPLVSALKPASSVQDASPSSYHTNDLIDTNDIIHHSLSDSMRTSLQTLRDLETKPSCYKVAAASLIHSCSTLDGSITPADNDITRGADFIVHEEINIYAARLAVCELSSAKAPVPQQCRAFVPTIKSVKRTSWAGYLTSNGPTKPRQLYPEYDEITEQGLESCLSALHSSNQAWTSFTSSKQNAAIMCHSMRGEVERDREIHLHKILSTVTEDVVTSLHNSKEDWRRFKEGYHELANNMRQTHLDLMQADEQRLEAAQRIWAQWQADVQDLSHGVQQIRTDVDQAHDSLQDHNQRIRNSAAQVSGQFTDLAVQHRGDMRSLSEETGTTVELVEYLYELVSQRLITAALNAGQSIDTVNAQVSNMTTSLAVIQTRFDTLQDTANDIDKIKSSVASLSDVLNGNWIGTIGLLETGAAFVAYTVVYSLMSVGVWQRFTPFPGYICASLATGLVFAYLSVAYWGPFDAVRMTFQLLFPIMELATLTTWPSILVLCTACIILALACLHYVLFGTWMPRRQGSTTGIEAIMPSSDTKALGWYLPHSGSSGDGSVGIYGASIRINDPMYVAQMVERQIQTETAGSECV